MRTSQPEVILRKLAQCQEIIGYKFRDTSLLLESLTLGKNKRLALAGDTYVQVALVDRWFSLANTTRLDFNRILVEAVSNDHLSKVGFERKINFCTIPNASTRRQMADTVEAILGAVYRDALFHDGSRNAASWDEFENVVARLGINHRLIASTSDLRWSLTPMRTTRKILPGFFSRGNHFELAKLVAGVSSSSQPPKLASSDAHLASAQGSEPASNHADKVDSEVGSSGSRRPPKTIRHKRKSKKRSSKKKRAAAELRNRRLAKRRKADRRRAERRKDE